jgi:hypothetical protein
MMYTNHVVDAAVQAVNAMYAEEPILSPEMQAMLSR